jgi:hypothetical protein
MPVLVAARTAGIIVHQEVCPVSRATAYPFAHAPAACKKDVESSCVHTCGQRVNAIVRVCKVVLSSVRLCLCGCG